MNKRIIAVTGATGAQGGGLVQAILADKQSDFRVRAVTRKPDGDRARALAKLGVEVVRADLDDPASLAAAFAGAYGAYCMTNFWEHFSPERETAQGRALADAAKKSGVKHVVWSTFEDTRKRVPLDDARMPTLLGKYKVPHFDAKAEADRFFTELGVPTTFLFTSYYWDNLFRPGAGPRKGPEGKLVFTLPMGDKKLPGIAAADIGKCAYGIFRRPDLVGRRVGVAGEHLTGAEMAAALGHALGQPVVHYAPTPDTYRGLGFPGADETGNMFQYKADFNAEYCGLRDVALCRQLAPELQTFAGWLTRNKERVAIA